MLVNTIEVLMQCCKYYYNWYLKIIFIFVFDINVIIKTRKVHFSIYITSKVEHIQIVSVLLINEKVDENKIRENDEYKTNL